MLIDDDNDDDSTLPEERNCGIPPALIASFPTVDPVQLNECRKKYSPDGIVDVYNDLSQNIERDDDNIVKTTQELVDKVNEYDYNVVGPGDFVSNLAVNSKKK